MGLEEVVDTAMRPGLVLALDIGFAPLRHGILWCVDYVWRCKVAAWA